MDKVYVTTKAGRRILRDGSATGDELKVLQFIKDNRSASESQVEVVGSRWMVRHLQKRGLVKELTE